MLRGMDSNLPPSQNRQLESVVRFGTISAIDLTSKPPMCRAKSGGLNTDWLKWITLRAGNVRVWNPPSIGEECIILSPSGDTRTGAILTGLFNSDYEAPETDENVTARHWDDGAVERYDQAAHEYLLDVPAGGTITLKIGGSSLVMTDSAITLKSDAVTVIAPPITLQGNVLILGSLTGQPGAGGEGGNATFNGRIDATVDVTAAGVSLKNHKHSGVQAGSSQTGAPVGG
jgi:phage baseplate assembly protein V